MIVRAFQNGLVLFVSLFSALTAYADEARYFQTETLESGHFEYDPTKAMIETYGDSYRNKNGKYDCDSDVKFIQIRYQSPFRDYINQRLKMGAEAARCQEDIDESYVSPTVTFSSPQLISVQYEITRLSTGGNGSCHTQYKYLTFDLQTGKEYKPADLLRAADFPKIKNDIIDFFKSQENLSLELLESHLDDDFWALDIYLDNGSLYIDMNDYLRSCADGPHFPFPISRKYLKDTSSNQVVRHALGIH
jgi:hypothetical protein